MPVLRIHLSLVRRLSCIAKRFLVNNVKYNLWIDITTSGAGTGFCVSIVGCFFKIGNGVNGIAVEYRVSAPVKQPQAVKQLVDVAGWLVDVDDNELALECLLFQQVDDFLCVGRRKSRCGFVKEKYRWLAYEFECYVQTFALASRDVFVDGRTYFQMLDGVESQVLEGFHYTVIQVFL